MFRWEDLLFRKLEKDDLYHLISLKQDSWMTTHRITLVNEQDQDRWFNSLDQEVHSPNNLVLFATHNEGNNIGIFKIFNIDWVSRSAFAAWDVFYPARGKGFGKKLVTGGSAFCFHLFNLRRLECEILESNYASMKCADAAGFVREGVKRDAVLKVGKLLNSYVYGVLSHEFLALHPIQN